MPEQHKKPTTREPQTEQPERVPRNMHEGVEADEDAPCICSPEPRWQALAEEMERKRQEKQEGP